MDPMGMGNIKYKTFTTSTRFMPEMESISENKNLLPPYAAVDGHLSPIPLYTPYPRCSMYGLFTCMKSEKWPHEHFEM